MSPETFRRGWAMQTEDRSGRTPSLRERVEAIVTRVQRAALAAKGERSDAAIDAMLLAALVTAGADEIRAKLEEHEDGSRAV